MITTEQFIPCPVCETKIPFNAQQLIQGYKFTCPTCTSAVGISARSMDLVKNTMTKFDEIKKKSMAERAKL